MSSADEEFIEIDSMSIDQLAGAIVLVLGALGSLLLVIWQSRCACRCRIGCSENCYIFDCAREPPNEDELQVLADEAKTLNKKENKVLKKEDEILKKEDDILKRQNSYELEPEPEPQIDKIV